MFKRALIIAALNPLHEGHEYLFSKTQEFAKSTDIYIGRKNKPIDYLMKLELKQHNAK